MRTGVLRILFTVFLVMGMHQLGYAQYQVQHQPPTILDNTKANNLEFFVPGVLETEVVDALLFYRTENDIGYSQKEAVYANGSFNVTLFPEELTGSNLQYYFQLSVSGLNQDVFFPDNVPAENPIEVQIIASEAPITATLTPGGKQLEEVDYTIISPKPGNGLAPADVFIAIALYYDKQEIPEGSFRLLVNNLDVTELADTSDYFISYAPKGLARGEHSVRLNYVTETETFEITSWVFRVVQAGKATFQRLEPRFFPSGRVELTARNQVISGDLNNAYTGRSYIGGSYGLFKYSLNGFFTSQESSRLQPQNRYSLAMSLGKWWKFEAGHVFPRLSRFTISGRRIYGVNTSMHLLWENINVQFLYGEISRKITNRYTSITAEDVFAGAAQDSVVDRTYTLGYQEAGRGTFTRKVIGGRVAIGNPRFFQLGVQAMKVEDDSTSIFNVVDYSDIGRSPTTLLGNLTLSDQQRLSIQPELLRIQGGSPRPKGNFVAGADLRFAFADNKIRFQTETVASALNNDIYGGPLDSLRAADLGFEDIDPDVLNILDEISQLIIVNENVSVLPIRVTGLTTDTADVELFFPTAILGSHSEFSINYPSNTFRLQYRWIGPDFNSLANSTIRKDIAGFTATDRFRMFQNQVYVTLGYETLTDNVSDTKEATTTTNSIRSNISWFPRNQKLPRISTGFRIRSRDNGVARFNPEVPQNLELASVQNIRIVEGDTILTTTPRMNSTVNLNFSITQEISVASTVHDATITLSSLDTKDEVFAFGDVANQSFSFSIASRYEQIPLRTQLGMTMNQTESGSGQLNIDIFGVYAGGSYFFFDGKLNVNGRLAYTSNTSKQRKLELRNTEDNSFLNDYYTLGSNQTTSEFSTYVFLAGAEYKLNTKHSFVFTSNFTNVSGQNSLNDRIVQLRYIYRF